MQSQVRGNLAFLFRGSIIAWQNAIPLYRPDAIAKAGAQGVAKEKMPEKNLFETTVASLPESDHRMRTWLGMLGCFTSIERSLRRRFSRVFGASLPRYDVLTALVQFPTGLTMGQLASKLMVSKGNITGVVRRLQNAKCVSQTRSSADKRVQVVTVTAKGKSLWEQMHTEYRSVIEELLSRLSKTETEMLTRKLLQTQEKIDHALQRRELA